MVAVAADEDVFVEELSNENAHITFKVSVSPEFAKNCYNEILEVSTNISSGNGTLPTLSPPSRSSSTVIHRHRTLCAVPCLKRCCSCFTYCHEASLLDCVP